MKPKDALNELTLHTKALKDGGKGIILDKEILLTNNFYVTINYKDK